MAQDNIFIGGMSFRKPREGAPEFIKGSISIKLKDFFEFAKQHNNGTGWMNIDLKKSKGGKLYLSLNTWKKGDKKEDAPQQGDEFSDVNAALDESGPDTGEDNPF